MTCLNILFIVGSLLIFTKRSISFDTLNYLGDQEFKRFKFEKFAVFLHSKSQTDGEEVQNVLKSMNESIAELQALNVILGLIDCENSTLDTCKQPESLNHALLYSYGNIVGVLSSDQLQTPLQTKALLRHHLLLEDLVEVADQQEYQDIQKKFIGEHDLLFFYIPALGTEEHVTMIDRALRLPANVIGCFTTNRDICIDESMAWYLSCEKEGDECERLYSSDMSEDSFKSMLMKINPMTNYSKEVSSFVNVVKKIVNQKIDVLVLVAGSNKVKEAEKIAKSFATAAPVISHCILVDRIVNEFNQFLPSRIDDNRIFAVFSPGTLGNPYLHDLGYLESETLDHVIELFKLGMQHPKVMEARLVRENSTENDNETDKDGNYHEEELQDDPVAFSLTISDTVRNLYYFDYRTIRRLTDKTFVKVVQSSDYAVILFTLEFNSRALVALMNFVEIHQSLKEKGNSPLYRVECYNWPDVCKDAGVYTTPRMFFFPAGSTNQVEFQGMWDKHLMEEAITRYSLPEVVVMKDEQDIENYFPLDLKSVVGFFEVNEGVSEFREQAKIMRDDFVFIEMHKGLTSFVKEKWATDFEHGKLLALEGFMPKAETGKFETKEDIAHFIEPAFNPKLQELTAQNFVSILADDNPLLIYFWNGSNKESIDLKTMSQLSLDAKFNLLFTSMDSSPGTMGEFILQRYNAKSKLTEPVVAFFDKKGSVMLKSCGNGACDVESLSLWIQDCMQGKVAVTYSLDTEEWKPRLAGYDFLEMMKQEGTYPENLKKKRQAEEEDTETSTSHGGRLQKLTSANIKRKKASMEETELSSNTKPTGSHAHTEL